MSVTLSVPQWSIGTTISLFRISGSATWLNPTILTADPYYGSMFSNTSNTIFLTGNYSPCSTPGTLFTLKDTDGNSYPLSLTVIPPAYTVSSAGVVYVADASTNLPIVFTAPTSISAILNVSDSRLIPGPSNVITRDISAVFTSYTFSPILPGGLQSAIDGSGNISISGTPSVVRAQTTYTLYSRTSKNQTVSTVFPLQVASARYQFSNISGTVVSNATASATFNYKKPNHIVVGVSGLLGNVVYASIPAGMSLAYDGTRIDMSGTPTQFIDSSRKYEVTLSNFRYSTNLTYTLGMNPCLEILAPADAYAYSNIPYTSNSPIFRTDVTGYPSACNSFDLSVDSLDITPTGGVFGTISADQTVTITASGSTLCNTKVVQLYAIPDAVTFRPYVSLPITQNIKFSNSFTATAASSQPVTYSVSPLFDGPIGVILNTSTGSVEGTPRGVSTQSNYTITATTPQGVTSSLPIVLSIIPDYVTISSYGLSPYASESLRLIQGHPVLQSEYPFPLGYRAETYSGDPIIGIFSTNFPEGVSLRNGNLTGTPTASGTFTGTVIARSLNGVTASISLEFQILEDLLFTTVSTDFVVDYGSLVTYSLSGYALSGALIQSYSLYDAPAGVTITPAGELTIDAQEFHSGTPFLIDILTYAGVTITKPATLTVNDSTIGRFISPNGPIVLPGQSYYPIITEPEGFSFYLLGDPSIEVDGSNLHNVLPLGSEIFPPLLLTLIATENVTTQVRVSTQPIELPPLDIFYRWTQYVPIAPIVISGSSNITYSIPNPPPGMRWNPIYSQLTGSPTSLTIQDSFVVYATDATSVRTFSVKYSVATPTYLRIFSAPSSYTNYVKQRAFINAAAHAINGVAYLPEPLIASQTGPYPPDITKDPICLKCFDPKRPPLIV